MYAIFLGLPLVALVNNWACSQWTSFYPRFTTKEKHEWVGWTNSAVTQGVLLPMYAFGYMSAPQLAGYFGAYNLFDALHLSLYKRDRLMLLHHILSAAVAYAAFAIVPQYAAAIAHATFYLETSIFVVGLTWLLNRAGYSKTPWFKALGAFSVVVYSMNRCVFFPWYLFTKAPTVVLVLLSPFLPMNVFWTWQLVQYYQRILTKGKREEDVSSTERCPEASSCSPDRSDDMPPPGCRTCTQLASPGESQ
jgi:hypothetical protein